MLTMKRTLKPSLRDSISGEQVFFYEDKYGVEWMAYYPYYPFKFRTKTMTRAELLNQVAEKIERCEYTPIVTTKEELPIWTMLLNKVYEETFKTKEK